MLIMLMTMHTVSSVARSFLNVLSIANLSFQLLKEVALYLGIKPKGSTPFSFPFFKVRTHYNTYKFKKGYKPQYFFTIF